MLSHASSRTETAWALPGLWGWNERGGAWVPGGWRIPPSPGMRWRPAHGLLTLGGAVREPEGWAP